MRLWPGCVCQPEVPPGTQTLLWTYRSEGPFVFWNDSQRSLWALVDCGKNTRLFVSIWSNRPSERVVLVNPEDGVAWTFPARTAALRIASPTSRIRIERGVIVSSMAPDGSGVAR